jgi:hypothetical protein
VASIYSPFWLDLTVPDDAPPLFLVLANDDPNIADETCPCMPPGKRHAILSTCTSMPMRGTAERSWLSVKAYSYFARDAGRRLHRPVRHALTGERGSDRIVWAGELERHGFSESTVSTLTRGSECDWC